MKNLKTGKRTVIYETSTNSLQSPSISNRYVVWSESPSMHVNSIKVADLKTGEVFELQAAGPHQNSHTSTSIWKDTAAWMSWRTGNGDIYVFDGNITAIFCAINLMSGAYSTMSLSRGLLVGLKSSLTRDEVCAASRSSSIAISF